MSRGGIGHGGKSVKKGIACGLILMLAVLVFLCFSKAVVFGDEFTLKASVDNSINYNEGLPMQVSVSAYFNADQHFYLNFTKGRFWGDVNDLYEPADRNFAPNASIPPYKVLYFSIYTPSEDVVLSLVYLVAGIEPYAVVYINQSTDFVPLLCGNLTLGMAGMEGMTTVAGNFTFTAISIVPYVEHLNSTELYDVVAHGQIQADPPLTMSLYEVTASTTLVGDLNGDGKVSLTDLQLLANAYSSKPGDPNWNPLADLAPPYGIISLTDLVTLAIRYGQHNP